MVSISMGDLSCCVSSLDMSLTANVLSGISTEIINTSVDLLTYAPNTANNAQYCSFTALTSSSLFGYKEYMYLADGSCINDYYQCSTTGLNIFGNKGCVGVIENIPLSSTATPHLSGKLGSVSGSIVSIGQAKSIKGWVTYLPPQLMVPKLVADAYGSQRVRDP